MRESRTWRRAVVKEFFPALKPATSSLTDSAGLRTDAWSAPTVHHSFAHRARGATNAKVAGLFWAPGRLKGHARCLLPPRGVIIMADAARASTILRRPGESPVTSQPYDMDGITPDM